MKAVRLLALVAVLSGGVARAGAPAFGARLDVGPSFPVSDPQASVFGPGVGLAGAALLEPLPLLDVMAQASWLMVSESTTAGIGRGGNMLGVGLGLRLKRPLQHSLVVPFAELVAAAAVTGTTTFQLQPAAGVLFRWSESVPVWLGANVRLSQVFKPGAEPAFDSFDASVVSVGLVLEFHSGSVAADGDGDGVEDAKDACPTEAGRGPDGCALVEQKGGPPVDRDRDGVADDRDACAGDAEDQDGFKDDDGCPDTDDDTDGVPDVTDQCRTEPGPLASGGCPDADGDGIADKKDPCPRVAGPAGGDGCPRYKEVTVTETKIELQQKVFFAFGATTILPRSYSLLDEVVQVLRDRDRLCVVVEGHTDNKGNADANLQLSQGRAQAVADYLVSHGVAGPRLKARGYGSTLPRDDNSTADGRDNNRRVEFTIVPCTENAP